MAAPTGGIARENSAIANSAVSGNTYKKASQRATGASPVPCGRNNVYASIYRAGLFDGRHVIVTGGGSGIGRCTAHGLAALGAEVALVGRKQDKLAAVQQEIVSAGAKKPSVHVCDIREEAEVKATIAAIAETHGRIDALINNAGGQFAAPLKDISQKGWETVVRTNLTGGFVLARECFIQSMEKNGGAIVNVLADMWTSMPGMG